MRRRSEATLRELRRCRAASTTATAGCERLEVGSLLGLDVIRLMVTVESTRIQRLGCSGWTKTHNAYRRSLRAIPRAESGYPRHNGLSPGSGPASASCTARAHDRARRLGRRSPGSWTTKADDWSQRPKHTRSCLSRVGQAVPDAVRFPLPPPLRAQRDVTGSRGTLGPAVNVLGGATATTWLLRLQRPPLRRRGTC